MSTGGSQQDFPQFFLVTNSTSWAKELLGAGRRAGEAQEGGLSDEALKARDGLYERGTRYVNRGILAQNGVDDDGLDFRLLDAALANQHVHGLADVLVGRQDDFNAELAADGFAQGFE